MPTRVMLAGQLAVEVDGIPVDLGALGRLGRLFWAFLVCERRRPVGKDELAEVLWGEDELPRSWEQMLRGNATKVRAALLGTGSDPGVEVVSAFGAYQIRLPPDAVVDVEQAALQVEDAVAALRAGGAADARQAATAALAVAALGFLPGWPGVWVERRQTEMRELRLRAQEVLGEACCALGFWAEGVAAGEGAVSVEPFRESAYQLLMAAHRGAGNPGEALRAYERCRRVLADELGVTPSAATEKAYLVLLEEEAGPVLAEPVKVPLPGQLSAAPSTFFTGRKPELDRLRTVLERTTTDGRQAVLLGGEPGIGKTALIGAFAREAHAAGAQVLYGRCDEGLGVAYQPFAEALGHYVLHCPPWELSAFVATHGTELSWITPELVRQVPDAPAPLLMGAEGDRYRLFEAVTAFIDRASRRERLVLLLDDLHWAAPPTLALLRHLLRSRAARVVVVGTYRHTEVGPDHPLTATLADLRRESGVERLLLEGLDEQGVAAIIEHAEANVVDVGGIGLARALHARTGGNPFFVGEFLRHLAESGAAYREAGARGTVGDTGALGLPEGVREVVSQRLSRLSAAAYQVLTLAAVVGPEFDLALLERIDQSAGTDTVLDALDEAVVAQVIGERQSGRYYFAHALVRDTIYSTLTANRRARFHHRVGDALESLPGDRDSHLPALAHHYVEAASDGAAVKAGDYSLAAARQAFGKAAWEDVVAYARAGLGVLSASDPEHLVRRFDLLLLEVETQMVVVKISLAVEAMKEAAEVARALGSPERLARAVSLYLLSEGAGDPRASELALEALDGIADTELGLRTRLRAGLAVSMPSRHAGRWDPETRSALALARESGDRDAVHAALVARRTFLCESPHGREWLAVEEELTSMGPPAEPVAGTRWIHGVGRGRANALLALGDRDGFEAHVPSVERWYTELRNLGLGVQLAIWRGVEALLDGRFGEVEGHASSVLRLAPNHQDAWAIQLCKRSLELGRPDAFKGDLLGVVATRPRHPILQSMLAFTHTELGEDDDARQIVDDLAADDFRRPRSIVTTTTFAYLAEVIVALGETRLAARLYELFGPYAGMAAVSQISGTHCPGAIDRYLGQLAASLGKLDEAEAHYEAALVLETALRSPPLLARTRYWYARLLLKDRARQADAGRGRDLAMRALATAEDLGMARLTAQVSELL